MKQNPNAFSPKERQIVLIVSFIVFARMSALFLPLPIFSPLAGGLEGATEFLVGLALGIYALMQSFLQIPLGFLSDKFGRKKIIIIGLILFLLGSLMCCFANNIYFLIFARFIQGLGAVSSSLSALIADETRINQRAKAMAIIGSSVGLSFFICTISSPLIANYFGFKEVFYLISLLALLSLVFATLLSKSKDEKAGESIFNRSNIFTRKLVYLDVSVFVAHFILSANFFIIPLILIESFFVNLNEHWKIYLFALVFAIPAMIYTVFLVDKFQRISRAFIFALCCLALSLLLFSLQTPFLFFVLALVIFFSGFSSLETLLPTLASSNSGDKNKGLVMGVFTTSQQLGSALGAFFAGIIGFSNGSVIFGFNLVLIFLIFMAGLKIYPQFNLSKHKIQNS